MIRDRDLRDLHWLRHQLGLSDPAFEHALKRAAGVTSPANLEPSHLPAVARELRRLAGRGLPMLTSLELTDTRRRR